MKYFICLSIAFLILSSFAYAEEVAEQTVPEKGESLEPKEIVAAEVNEQPIYLSDLTRQMNMLTGGRINRQDRASYVMIREQVLNSLINEELIHQSGLEAKLAPTDEELSVEMDKVKSKQTPEQFQQALKTFGLTEEKLTSLIKRNLTIRNFIEKKVQPLAKPVTDKDISDYYEANKEKYVEPEQVRARHILVKVTPDATDAQKSAAKEKIQGILDKVKNGGDFAELAKENSDCPSSQQGGDLGFFSRGQMVKPFEDATFALEPDGISDIVETEFGHHIIKFEEKKPGKQLTLEEVKSKIEGALSEKEMDQALGDWLKPIREKASIKFLLKGSDMPETEGTE